jgi:AcrR family transcriptional regulator
MRVIDYLARWIIMESYGIHRKDKLILTTIEIIDELGIQGLSTREIARRQGISEAALFRHYRSKNDLILAVLENYSQFDADIHQSIGQKELSPKEAIVYMVTVYAEYFNNYPAITSITHLFDILRSEPDFRDKIRNIVYTRINFTKQLFEDAQKSGELIPNIDCEILSDILWGVCREISLKWRLDGQDFLLKERILLALQMLLDAYTPATHSE